MVSVESPQERGALVSQLSREIVQLHARLYGLRDETHRDELFDLQRTTKLKIFVGLELATDKGQYLCFFEKPERAVDVQSGVHAREHRQVLGRGEGQRAGEVGGVGAVVLEQFVGDRDGELLSRNGVRSDPRGSEETRQELPGCAGGDAERAASRTDARVPRRQRPGRQAALATRTRSTCARVIKLTAMPAP